MWIISKSEWNKTKKSNNKEVESIPRAGLAKISSSLNERVNYSEKWFEEVAAEFYNCDSQTVILRKNHPIANRYFADYYIKEHKIVIEIDESSHDPEKDKIRDAHFKEHGIKLTRIRYGDKIHAVEVIKWIKVSFGCKFVFAKSVSDMPVKNWDIGERINHVNSKNVIRKISAKPLSERQKRVIEANKKRKAKAKEWHKSRMEKMMKDALKK